MSEESNRGVLEERLSINDDVNIRSSALVLSRSVQAETNYCLDVFRNEFIQLMQAYLRDRAVFYRQLADQLDAAANVFQLWVP